MKLLNLSMKNYRNCIDLDLDFGFEKVLIIGKNAQGKTNILESVYFLSCLKSPRTSNNLELINLNSQFCSLSAVINKSKTDIELDFSYKSDKKRELLVNKLKTTPKNFKTVLKTVLFSSEDLSLVRGTPQDRRDWLDRAVAQIYPAYDERLSKYDKIRVQKNNLLKEDYVDKNLLDIYNEQLVITGSNIIYLRKKYLNEIEKIASDKHKEISQIEKLSLKYVYAGSDDIDANNEEISKIAQTFREKLELVKEEELKRKQSLVGPHRDDIVFYINDMDSLKFASQGQQRTIVLALKLAEIEMIKNKTGFSPVLLLDDVLAELDDLRQNYLLKSIKSDTQTIITSVDTLLFDKEFLEGVKIYKVENGNIIEK